MSVNQTAGNTAESIQAVNQILQVAQNAEAEHAKKMIKANLTMALKSASPSGVGENVDLVG